MSNSRLHYWHEITYSKRFNCNRNMVINNHSEYRKSLRKLEYENTFVSGNKFSPAALHQNHATLFINILESNTKYNIEFSICQKS